MTTPKSALHQHKGQPVPWITRWTGEVVPVAHSFSVTKDGRARVFYPDGIEDRDPNGVLWKREGLGRHGTPQYAQVNAYRQRAAMRRRLCQICGSKIDERPIRWLVDDAGLHYDDDDGTAITGSAPTCSSCIPLALELCPHLKKGYSILKVLDYEPWGLYGQAVEIDIEAGKRRDLRGVYVPYADSPIELSAIVAFQEIVRLTKYVIEEEA